jgi:TPR repeat protein
MGAQKRTLASVIGIGMLQMETDEEIYQNAFNALQSETTDPVRWVPVLEKLASNGDHRAMYALSNWYFYGKGVPRNFRKANLLARKAASLGNSESAYDLAVSYDLGRGLKKNPIKAFQYYLLSSLLGDIEALGHASRMCAYGHGIPKNKKLAEMISKIKTDPVPYY